MWSIGVIMWEVMTLGATPYIHVRDLLTRVTRGLRLAHPLSVSDTLYQLMLTCWMLDPDERPNPAEVRGEMSSCQIHQDECCILTLFPLSGFHFGTTLSFPFI